MEELVMWRNKVEKAEMEKSRLLLEKLSAEDAKKQTQNETIKLLERQKNLEDIYEKANQAKEDSILQLEKGNQALRQQLRKNLDMLEVKKAEYSSLLQKSKVKADIPETKLKFTGVETEGMDKNYQYIVGVFTITQKPSLLLAGGQALITFEEEKVAGNILQLPSHSVMFGNNIMDLKPCPMTLDPSVKFEVHMNVSKRKLRFSDLYSSMPSDGLEIGFSKPSRGGGEVEQLAYNKDTGTGEVTFLNTGVAESLALKREYPLDAENKVYVPVQPSFEYQLKRFQTYCGISKRTVLLSGIEDVQDEEDLQDLLEIHFQKSSNKGGEVENIKYVSRPKTVEAYFSEDTA